MHSVFPFPFPFFCVFGIDVEGFGMILPLIYIDNCLPSGWSVDLRD